MSSLLQRPLCLWPEGVFDFPKAMSVADGDKALFEEIANLFLNEGGRW